MTHKKVNPIHPLGDQIILNKAFVVTNEISERRLENARWPSGGTQPPGAGLLEGKTLT